MLIAEMAVHLNVLAFLDHLVEFFSSNADQRFFHTFSAAVAVELCGQCIIDLDIKTFQYFYDLVITRMQEAK